MQEESLPLEHLRREYLRGGLRRNDLDADPLRLFRRWMEQAIALELPDPTAMVLGTVDEGGQPSQRIVLLKHFDAEGFVFYTNYRSRKAREIDGHAKVSLLFPWYAIERQVMIRGSAERVSAAQSLKYFLTRPRDSQLAAWASPQSSPIDSRAALDRRLEEHRQRFADADVPRPDFWGGFRVRPVTIEFWQGGAGRLHDRFEYAREESGGWRFQRLAP